MPPGTARRRVLCLWLPRLVAELALRRADLSHLGPGDAFAVVDELRSALRLVSVDASAAALGLAPGRSLADARAAHPALVTRPRRPGAEARGRAGLIRWARRFSPWVGEDLAGLGEGALALDVTGCAHLFGGERAMAERMVEDLAALGLTARAGLADCRGAAWALARFAAGEAAPGGPTGDAVQVDAPATRVRSPARRRPEARALSAQSAAVAVAPPGATRAALADLPPAALRIPEETAAGLARLGLRRIGDLAALPRASLARRFGADLVTRLDQALGVTPEPVSPLKPPERFAARLSLPEPIGLRSDLEAALARLLARLEARLEAAQRGARRLRLSVRRVDGSEQAEEVGLARPARDPGRLAPLFDQALERIEAGFGIDAVRLEATQTEPLAPRPHSGHLEARAAADARRTPEGDEAFADLLGRLGARVGLERITRWIPAESHIPEKTAHLAAAAWSAPAEAWPSPPAPRPILLFRPEPATVLTGDEGVRPPAAFRWRRAEHRLAAAAGPERIAPEWWLDDPEWRGGARDYWRVETETGVRLWLFALPGGGEGWFVHGIFA